MGITAPALATSCGNPGRRARDLADRVAAAGAHGGAVQRGSAAGGGAVRTGAGTGERDSGGGSRCCLFAVGYGVLLLVNRFVYRVCPTCAHDHDHNACSTELHGFAAPLIIAAAVHSFLDGWSVATVQLTVPLGLRVAVPLAVALHKLTGRDRAGRDSAGVGEVAQSGDGLGGAGGRRRLWRAAGWGW